MEKKKRAAAAGVAAAEAKMTDAEKEAAGLGKQVH